jgi:uncharacterized protein (TIGR03067 family)
MGTLIAGLLVAAAVSSAAGRPADDQAGKELAALAGTWKLVSLEANGEARELRENPRWVIKGTKVLYGGDELAGLTIDPATTPRSIDLAFRNPKRVSEGIYTVEKDTLKVCLNHQTEGVKERPQGFATKGKPGWRLLVFQRDQGDPTEGLHAFIGIAIGTVPDKTEYLIKEVIGKSPAEKAGLKKDDVLLRVGGQEAPDLLSAINLIREAKPGSDLTLRIRRDGKEQDVTVKPGVFPFRFLLE